MTAPAEPGSNDEVIRIVYQAVADYSQLLRENRRARDETRALKREIDSLAGETRHTVRVTADTAQARTELARVLRDVMVTVKVTVDALQARTEIARLIKDVTVKAKVVVDAVTANTELNRVLRDVVIKARIVVDAATARADIAAATRDTEVKVRVRTDSAGLAALAAQLSRLRDLAVTVSIRTDTAAVQRLRDLLARLRDLTVTVAVRVDDTDAARRLQALIARLRELAGVITVRIDLDDTGAQARLEALLTAGEGLQLHIDLDEDGLTARFRALIARLQEQARIRVIYEDDQDHPPPTPPRPAPGGGGGGRRSGSIIPEGLDAAAGMILKFLPLIAAAVPVAAALTVAIGAVGGALLAAGAGAAIFAVAAVGAFAQVTKAVQAYEKSGTIATGPVAAVVQQFEGLKARYKELQHATEGPVFDVFNKGLQLAYDLLNRVQGVIDPAAKAIGGAVDQIDAAVKGPGFGDFLSFAADEAPNAISKLTSGLLGFGGGLGRLLMQFGPFARAFLDGFARMGHEFDSWAAHLDTNDGFQKFLTYAQAEIPKVIAFIGHLIDAGANVVAGLAPVGAVVLDIADAAAKFIAALPPGTLTALASAALIFAAAMKAVAIMQGISKIAAGLSTALGSLRGGFSGAAGAAGGFKSALAGVGAGLAIAAAVLVLNYALQKQAELQQEAADAANKHADALDRVGKQLAAGKDLTSTDVRTQQYDALMGATAEGKSGGVLGIGQDKKTLNLGDVSKAAGISDRDLVTGSLGIDPKLQSQNIGKLEAYRRTLLDAGDKTSADAVEKLETQYGALSLQVGEAADKAKAFKDATDASTTSSGKNTAVVATQAAAVADIKHILATTDFSTDVSVTAYDNATAALQAYDAQVQAHADAVQAVSDAEYASAKATQAVTDARLAAVQRIKDVQRSLRDMAIDEKQAALNVKTSDLSLQKLINSGATQDQIDQAKLDNERAHNALNDLRQDKSAKTTAGNKELGNGVEGNVSLVDAERSQAAAVRNVAAAKRNLDEATTKLTDLHLAFDTAASKLGLSEGAVRALKTNMNALKNKQVKVIVDTKDADTALARLLQTEYAIQLLAKNPNLTIDQAMAAALKLVPHTAAPALAPARPADPKNTTTVGPDSRGGGYAEGGPTVVSAQTSGAVTGPGTGTSDSVRVVLPVGGDARLSRGEHIVTDGEVQKAPGGHAYLEAFRAGLRSGRPWSPPRQPFALAAGGRAFWPAGMPAFQAPQVTVAVPGYAGGGPALRAAVQGIAGAVHSRTVNVNVGTINNPVPEPAGASLYRQVRAALDGDEK